MFPISAAGGQEAAPATKLRPKAKKATTGRDTANAPRRQRAGTKQARLIAMLEAPKGGSLTEIATAFGWQRHTVRGAIAGALKKKLGLNVTSEKVEGRGLVYRIAS